MLRRTLELALSHTRCRVVLRRVGRCVVRFHSRVLSYGGAGFTKVKVRGSLVGICTSER